MNVKIIFLPFFLSLPLKESDIVRILCFHRESAAGFEYKGVIPFNYQFCFTWAGTHLSSVKFDDKIAWKKPDIWI